MRPSMRFVCLLVFVLLCLSFFYTPRGSATTTFTVNDTGDAQDAALDGTCADTGGKCTLRAAIQEANHVAGADTIDITATGIIQLTGALPDLATDIDINGPGARVLSVRGEGASASNSYRIFTVTAGVTVNISGLTVTNGRAADGTTGLNINGDHGGGIRNDGTLTLTGVTVSGNMAGRGGGISSTPGNGGNGGGIHNVGTLTITGSTISGNSAGSEGNATATPFTPGQSGSGGGINNLGTLSISNSTISGNSAPSVPGGGGFGGGIHNNSGTVTASNSTITSNVANNNSGGGISNSVGGSATLKSSIVAGNAGGGVPDIAGTVQSDGFNLIGNTSGATVNQNPGAGPNVTGVDPQLNPLANNGGQTDTHSLQLDSPAIDKGHAFGSTTDQRGQTRPVDRDDIPYPDAAGGDGADIGAFELPAGVNAPAVVSVVRASANPTTNNTTVDFTVTFSKTVTGVDAGDFGVFAPGGTGAGVTNVTGSGATRTVSVNTGTGASSVRLDVLDDDSIIDGENNPLGNTGVGNGNFNTGEAYTINLLIRVNDSRAVEPSSGTGTMLFTIALTSPAPAPVTVNYSTADGGGNPATGGAACGAGVDYVSVTNGSVVFAAGEQLRTITLDICSDAAAEPDETFLLNLTGTSFGTLLDDQATGTITATNPAGSFLITELRTFGPGPTNDPEDDFVELYNNSDSALTVTASDGSAGWGVFATTSGCDSTPLLLGAIPNGTVIPARGHYLLTGSNYSLSDYGGTAAAAGDLTMVADLPANANVAVFSTSNVSNLSIVTRLDAVGLGTNTGAVCDLLREGSNLGAVTGSPAEHSFFRKQCDFVSGVGCTAGGNPKDTGDNLADFMFADTNGTNVAGIPPQLGSPGPENLASPVRRDTTGVALTLLDGTQSASAPPNRVRGFTSDPGNNSTFGTLTIRRRVTNTTGGPITRLRFRIVELTTFPAPPGMADLRPRTGAVEVSVGPITDAATCAASGAGAPPCNVLVQPTTLEQPASQPNGGGSNSTLAAGTITTGTPLAEGASLNVSFLLGIQQTGTFRFYVIIEADNPGAVTSSVESKAVGIERAPRKVKPWALPVSK